MALTNDYEMQSYAGHFESDGAAYNIVIPFEPHSFKAWNYTKYGTVGDQVEFVWFKDMPAGDVLMKQVIEDDGSTGDTNLVLETTNGITINNVASGVTAYRATITGATAASPVVITATSHGFGAADLEVRVRITKVVGMTELNNNEYLARIIDANSFSLHNFNGDPIDGTAFTAYSSGGQALLSTRILSNDTEVIYNPIVYQLTLGSEVMGADGDEIFFEAVRYNSYVDLGDIA